MERARGTPRPAVIRRVTRRVVVGAVMLAGLAGCGDEPTGKTDAPHGFDVPKGVHITTGGAKRRVGEKATVVYHIEQRAASAVTVKVTQVVQGTLRDFEFFNLPESVRTSTPYYVHVDVRNDGPSGLGGVAIPIFARTTHRVFPPNELVGEFRPCPTAALPPSFLPGATAPICLVFLVPQGEELKSIELQTAAQSDAVHFLVES